MKTRILRSYEVTTVEASALEELCNIKGRLKGLSLIEETRMVSNTCKETKYHVEVLNDADAWDTIVDGKNLFFHLFMSEANENKTGRKNNRYLRAMKKICVKDIEAKFDIKTGRKHI